MTEPRRRVDAAADEICAVAEEILNHTRENVWGLEWEWDDEDSLRDTVDGVERYRRWQKTGEHGYAALRPGLEPHAAMADGILNGLGSVLPYWEQYGDELDSGLVQKAEQVMDRYWLIRQEEGGPGSASASTWNR